MINNTSQLYLAFKEKHGAGLALALIFVLFSIQFFVGGYMLQYSFQYWIGLVRDNPVLIPFGACGIAACVSYLNRIYLTLFFITWLVKLAN